VNGRRIGRVQPSERKNLSRKALCTNMMTLRTHQSAAYPSREAAWQGCALAATAGTGRVNLRSLPFQAFGRLDTRAISLISRGLKLGRVNPETDP
jgi:hypothetical protein